MAANDRPGNGHPDGDPPLGEIPEFDRGELQSDVLAFERIKRRPPERQRGIILIIVLLVLAGGGYAGWLTMGEPLFGGGSDSIPVIRAAEGPIKVRPDKPGGIEIKNRDIEVYKRIGGDQPERLAENLLPRPERPLPAPAPAKPEAIAVPAQTDGTTATAQPGTEDATPGAGAEKLIAGAEAAIKEPVNDPENNTEKAAKPSPEKVAALSEPPAPPAPPAVKGETAAAKPEAPSNPTAQPTKKASSAAATPALTPTPVPAPPPAPAGTRAKSAEPGPGAGYSVQLAAVRDEKAARGEWQRLRGRHAELLGTLSLRVVRADLGAKGVFYRLRAGALADKAAARDLCQALAKKKVGCLVVPPGG